MTETFSSGFSTPLGSGQDMGEPTSDVTSTLAELERKLRELERELTSIGRRRVRPETPMTEAPTGAAVAPREDTGRLVDEQVEFHKLPPPAAPAPPPPAPPAPAPPTPPQPAPPPPAAPASQPPAQPAPPPPTQPEADMERPRPTEAQLASLAELRRFRERLERFTKELLADYDAVLSRAMSGVAGRVAPEPSPALPTLEPPPPPRPAETLFEGRVELGVGPFYDIGSLSSFEQLVAGVPNVSEVAVRRFEASHAVVDVRLAQPVALVSELRRVLDTDFSVREVAPGRIQLAFEDV